MIVQNNRQMEKKRTHKTTCKVLHEYALDVRSVAWCPTMDIIAIVGHEGWVWLCRIEIAEEGEEMKDWEKIVTKSASELNCAATAVATSTLPPQLEVAFKTNQSF